MMPKVIEVPNYGRVEFPDDMTDEQIVAAIKKNAMGYQRPAEPETFDPTEGMSRTGKFLAGAGKGMTDLARGAGQILGMVSDADITESRRLDAPLMESGYAQTGNIVGQAAALAPAALIPGANTYLGSALVGAVAGAMQPTAEGESRLQNTAFGAAGGVAGQKLGNVIANKLSQKVATNALNKSQGAVRDATLADAQQAGYVVAPSQAGSGMVSRLMEGLSGKYKTNQLASIKNQKVTDSLARKALGLSEDVPLTRETLQNVRNNAFASGYEPLNNVGTLATDKSFVNALDNIVSDYQGAVKSFPGIAGKNMHGKPTNPIADLVDTFRVWQFDTGDAIKATRILRDDADKAFRAGDNALGKANKKLASALEDQIERGLSTGGAQDMLKQFRDARTLIAKTHTVENALREGGGNVNAMKLAARVQSGKPTTGELQTIGNFANNFKDVARVPESGYANPLTVLDYAAGGIGYGVNPLAMAIPAGRVASRYTILSQPYQRAFVHPQYGGAILNAANSASPALPYIGMVGGGLLGANY